MTSEMLASRSSGSIGPKPSTSSATAETSSSRVVPTMPGISCATSVRAACSTASRAFSLPRPSSLFGSSSSIRRWWSVNFSSLSATTFCASWPGRVNDAPPPAPGCGFRDCHWN